MPTIDIDLSKDLESACKLSNSTDPVIGPGKPYPEFVPNDPKSWHSTLPPTALGKFARTGSGSPQLKIEQNWTEMTIDVKSNIIDSIIDFLTDASAAVGQLATSPTTAIATIEKALVLLLGPVHRIIQVTWWFPLDLEAEGVNHNIIVRHVTEYAANVETADATVKPVVPAPAAPAPTSGGTSVPAPTVKWSFLETVTVDNEKRPRLNNAGAGQSTDDSDSFAINDYAFQLTGKKGIPVELVTKITFDFEGLKAELQTFIDKIQDAITAIKNAIKGGKPDTSTAQSIGDTIKSVIDIILSLSKQWSGSIVIKKTRLSLFCITDARFSQFLQDDSKTKLPEQKRTQRKSKLLYHLRPGDAALRFYSAAAVVAEDLESDSDSEETAPLLPVKIQIMEASEVAELYARLAGQQQATAETPVESPDATGPSGSRTEAGLLTQGAATRDSAAGKEIVVGELTAQALDNAAKPRES